MKSSHPPVLGPHVLLEHKKEQEDREKYGQNQYEREREEARRPKTVEQHQQGKNARTSSKHS